MKKAGIIYGVVMVLFFISFLISPRFGWHVKDDYSFSHFKTMWYIGTEKQDDTKILHYRGKNSDVSITCYSDGTYQIDYINQELGRTDSWAWESYDKFRESFGRTPFTIQSIGEYLYRQDKQERGRILYPVLLITALLALAAFWGGQKGIKQQQKMKRDLCFLALAVVTIVYIGTCLQLLTWSWLELFF